MGKSDDKFKFTLGARVAVASVFLIVFFAIFIGFYNAELQFLGIRPRTLKGLTGIFTAPLLHGDLTHLLSNSIPLLLAIPALFYFYYQRAVVVLLSVYILTGFWVWLSARDAVHLGASGVVNGILAYLFFAGLIQRNREGFSIAAAILFLYGAPLIIGFFPSPGISFEAHIAGATAGLCLAVYFSFEDKSVRRKMKISEDNFSSTSDEKIDFIYTYKSKNDSVDSSGE